MAFGQDIGGATLSYVARAVEGTVLTTTCKWDAKAQEIKRHEHEVEEPVVIFFPSGTTAVMAGEIASKAGFLQTPTILNFQAVDDASSIAGKFKFAMNERDRATYWKQMEQAVISKCVSSSGHPLPQGATFSSRSLYLDEPADMEVME